MSKKGQGDTSQWPKGPKDRGEGHMAALVMAKVEMAKSAMAKWHMAKHQVIKSGCGIASNCKVAILLLLRIWIWLILRRKRNSLKWCNNWCAIRISFTFLSLREMSFPLHYWSVDKTPAERPLPSRGCSGSSYAHHRPHSQLTDEWRPKRMGTSCYDQKHNCLHQTLNQKSVLAFWPAHMRRLHWNQPGRGF